MRRALTLAVLALSIFSFSALPQQAPSTGSIEGIVIRADTDQPIPNAQVTLTSIPQAPAAEAIAPVTTGADGKFSFADLKPATYRAATTASGFIRQEYGQRALNGSGRLLFVVAGQSINEANIRITPAGTVSGRILDENGQPATGAPVQLLRSFYNPPGHSYRSVGTASADDRGNYRIFGVTPGRYYLMAGTLPTVVNLFLGQRGGSPARSVRYSVVYYPNVSRLVDASTIEVKAGNESSIDLHLNRVTQTFHVRGRVIDPGGAPFPQNMTVTIGYNSPSGSGCPAANIRDSFDPATGTFDISNVPPGEFNVNITQTTKAPRGAIISRNQGFDQLRDQEAQRAMGLGASAPISVTNADVDGLTLTLTAGVTVQGKLIVEGQPISTVPNLGQLSLSVSNVLPPTGMGTPTPSTFAADGGFQVAGLREGAYRVQMNANPPGFYVKSIKYGDEDIAGRIFKFSSGGSGSFEVVLKAGTQSVTGMVTDSQSQPVPGIAVVFIPAQRERSDLFLSTNTDQTGKFTMTNLALGDYKVFSWESIDNIAYMDPEFLMPYEDLGKAISVAESANMSVDVKLIPAQ